jgi:hypothetical protein
MSLDVFTHKGFKLTGTALNIAPDSPVFARWAGPVLDKAGLLAAPARDHAAKADRRRLPGCARWRNERAKIQTGRARLTIGA